MRASPNALPSAPSFSHERPPVEIRPMPRSTSPGRVGRTSPSSPTARRSRTFAQRVGIDRVGPPPPRGARRASSTQADAALEVELHHEVAEPPEHPRPEPGVVAGFVERLLAQLDRLGHAPVVVADDRAQAERVGARGAGRGPIDRRLEDPVGLEVLGHVDEQALGGEAGSIERGHRIVHGRQAARLLVEARGVEGRAAQPGVLGGLGEGRRDGLVRAVRRLREVAGPRVLRLRRPGQRPRGPLEASAAGARLVHRLREQRVREPDDVAVDGDQVVVDRRPQVRLDPGLARSSVSIVGSAAAAARSIAPRVGSGSRETRPSISEPRLSGIGSVPWASSGMPVPDQRPAELERVQRVAARRLLDPHEHEPRKRPPEPDLEQLMERREVHRPERERAPAGPRGMAARSPPDAGVSAPVRTVASRPTGWSTSRRSA